MKTPAGASGVRFEMHAPSLPGTPPPQVRIIVWDRWLGRVKPENVYIDVTATVPRGGWQTLDFPLTRFAWQPGDEVEVRIELDQSLPAAQRGVAVHRIEYRTDGVTGDQ